MVNSKTFSPGVCLLLALFGCEQYKPKTSEGFTAQAQNIVFEKCVACHAGGAAEYGFGIVDKPSLMIANGFIVPGDPESSKLYQKLLAKPPYGRRMPYGGPYLNESELSAMREWIAGLGESSVPVGSEITVTLETTGLSAEPSAGNILVKSGSRLSLALQVREGDSLSGLLAQNIEGTCPKGQFVGMRYETGVLTKSCSLKIYADNPCTEILPNLEFEKDIQSILSLPIGSSSLTCTQCHYQGNSDEIPAYAATQGGLASQALVMAAGVIDLGTPRASKLYLRPSPEGLPRMPLRGSDFLSARELAKICNWIQDGAL